MTQKPDAKLYLRLMTYVRPHAKVFGLAILCMIAAAATEPLLPALLKPLLDAGFSPSGATTKIEPSLFALAILGMFLVRGILFFSSSYCMSWVANKVVLELRAAMFSGANSARIGPWPRRNTAPLRMAWLNSPPK